MAKIGGNKSPNPRESKVQGSPKRTTDTLSRTM
jgi:hypothetical protein